MLKFELTTIKLVALKVIFSISVLLSLLRRHFGVSTSYYSSPPLRVSYQFIEMYKSTQRQTLACWAFCFLTGFKISLHADLFFVHIYSSWRTLRPPLCGISDPESMDTFNAQLKPHRFGLTIKTLRSRTNKSPDWLAGCVKLSFGLGHWMK